LNASSICQRARYKVTTIAAEKASGSAVTTNR